MISEVSNLYKKTNYHAKTSDTESKFYAPSDFDKFTNEINDNMIKQKRVIKKSNKSRFINNLDIDKKIE